MESLHHWWRVWVNRRSHNNIEKDEESALCGARIPGERGKPRRQAKLPNILVHDRREPSKRKTSGKAID